MTLLEWKGSSTVEGAAKKAIKLDTTVFVVIKVPEKYVTFLCAYLSNTSLTT